MFTAIRKFVALTSACILGLALTGTAFAGPGNSKSAPAGGTTASSHRQPIHFGNGGTTASSHRQPIRFSHGFYYQGREHYHWSRYTWMPQYGCYGYYCPTTCCYYYWSEPTQCFYPVSYADTVVPTRSEQLLPINANNVNTNTNTNIVTTNAPAPLPVATAAGATTGPVVGARLPAPTE
jgi:hypothetical protein